MALGATAIGSLLGLGIQMYSNALRKLRHPWDYVFGMGLGAVVANKLVKRDDRCLQHLDEMLKKDKGQGRRNKRRFIGFGAGGTDALDCATGVPNCIVYVLGFAQETIMALFL